MFKKGDIVICIDDSSIINGKARYIKKGETYTVVEWDKDNGFLKIKNKKETFDYWYIFTRFEKK